MAKTALLHIVNNEEIWDAWGWTLIKIKDSHKKKLLCTRDEKMFQLNHAFFLKIKKNVCQQINVTLLIS